MGGNYGRNCFLNIDGITYSASCKDSSISPNYRLQNTSRSQKFLGRWNIHYISEAARCDIRDIITSLRPFGGKNCPHGNFSLMFLYVVNISTPPRRILDAHYLKFGGFAGFMDFWLNLAKFAKFCRFDNSPCLFPFLQFSLLFLLSLWRSICVMSKFPEQIPNRNRKSQNYVLPEQILNASLLVASKVRLTLRVIISGGESLILWQSSNY